MEAEKQYRGCLPLVSVSGFKINVKRRKGLRRRPDNGAEVAAMEMDPKEMAFVFAFEPHPVTFT